MSQPPPPPDRHEMHYRDATRCARGGVAAPSVTLPSAPALFQTAAFDVAGPEQLDAIFAGRAAGHIYTRVSNPNMEALAGDVAALERAPAAVVGASGMGILSAALLGRLISGDHVLVVGQHYGVTVQLLKTLDERFAIGHTLLATDDPAAARRAVRPTTRLALVETISNPTCEVADLPALAEALTGTVAELPGGRVPILADATFSPPPLMRCLDLGAEMVWHSVTKFLNGHGDVTLGVLAGPSEAVARVKSTMILFGLNGQPFESWLASRGLRTLVPRLRQACQTAAMLAETLAAHPAVARVYYPGLASQRTHAVARRLLNTALGYGTMLAFELAGGPAHVGPLCAALAHAIPLAPTLGDARTTITYPAMTSHRPLGAEQRQQWGISDALIRVSVGLEDAADVISDFTTALNTLPARG